MVECQKWKFQEECVTREFSSLQGILIRSLRVFYLEHNIMLVLFVCDEFLHSFSF